MKSIIKFKSLFLFLFFLVLSCSSEPKPEQTLDEIAVETPEALLEDENEKRGYSYGSSKSGWRYDEDIIMKLYQEALGNNDDLAALDSAINRMSDMEEDSLKNYLKYNETNLNYYSVANQYANRINDSLTKKVTIELFSNLEEQYKQTVSEYDTLEYLIGMKGHELQDQLVLMQLFITEPMMTNYQNNELPNINELENLLEEYKKLVKESEKYSKK
ncbi:MAG: hypothetical protein AB8B72_09420 [Crocinitomicaceae bacterium]